MLNRSKANPDPMAENAELRARLEEAEETLRAIRHGEVDALVLGDKLYTLNGTDAESNRFRGDMLAQVSDAVIAVDHENRVTYLNPAAESLYQASAADVLGRGLLELYLERWPGAGDEAAREALLRETGCWRGESIHRKRDGGEIPVESTLSLLRDRTGAWSGVLAVVRDISARRQAEEALRQTHAQLDQSVAKLCQANAEAEEARRRLTEQAGLLERLVAERTERLRETIGDLEAFSYSMAHDMRAPLRGMQGFASILLKEHAGALDETGRGYLKRIAASAVRMDALIRDVLSYTRVLRADAQLSRVDLDRLTRDIAATYPDLQAPNAEIQVEGVLPCVTGHEGLLTQCLSNLLSNAVKFVPDGVNPSVRIWAEERSESKVRLWIEDHGIGISQADRGRLFSMFQRLNPTGQFEGNGIGLTIVRKAVERMGGNVGFDSEPGKGSKFWIELKKWEANS